MPLIATDCVCCSAEIQDKQPAVLMPFVAKRALDWEPCEITPEWGLRDLRLGHAYALCNTLHCRHCGMVFLDMRFDDAEMARLYEDYRGDVYTTLRERFEPGYRSRNEQLIAGDSHIRQVELLLQPWVPENPKILDWGGDTGQNTPLRQQAARHDVLDISGKSLVPGAHAIHPTELPGRVYDLVVLSNVLEHVPKPSELLIQMHDSVGQGVLYLEVPFEALMREQLSDRTVWQRKRHWHEHINFFSPSSLERLMKRCGFQVLAQSQITLVGGTCQLAFVARALG